MNEYTVNLPLYSGIDKLEIGLSLRRAYRAPSNMPLTVRACLRLFDNAGAAAARPGLLYTNLIGRECWNVETTDGLFHSNVERQNMAQAFAKLDLAAFIVMDYD